MLHSFRSAVLAAGFLFAATQPSAPALAQQAPGWFVPGGGAPQAGQPRPAQPRPAAPPRPQARPAAPPVVQVAPPPDARGGNAPGMAGAAGQGEAVPQVPLPPVPDLPPIPRGPTPPAAVIGVLGIPDIMRGSSAAQQVEKVIGERREKLNDDAQKEQAAWRDLQQALATQRAGLSADQIRSRERELQERITNAQRVFRDRNRFIQEAAQVGLGQIERMLIAVIRQVAESRGMNLVLHRAQVALNVNEFDITGPVVEQMNKILPSVQLPPDGVSAMAAQAATPGSAAPGSAAPGPATPAVTAPAPASGPAPAVPVASPPAATPPRR